MTMAGQEVACLQAAIESWHQGSQTLPTSSGTSSGPGAFSLGKLDPALASSFSEKGLKSSTRVVTVG